MHEDASMPTTAGSSTHAAVATKHVEAAQAVIAEATQKMQVALEQLETEKMRLKGFLPWKRDDIEDVTIISSFKASAAPPAPKANAWLQPKATTPWPPVLGAPGVIDDGTVWAALGEKADEDNCEPERQTRRLSKRAKRREKQTKRQEQSDPTTSTQPSMRQSFLEGVTGPRKPLLGDAAAMKLHAKKQLMKRAYNVMDFYKTEGPTQVVARSRAFDYATLFVIVVNAFWIAIDTDGNHATVITEAKPMYQVADHSFCVFFTMELLIRFCAFEDKYRAGKDNWFIFDFVLVFLMVMETWVLPLFGLMGVPTEQLSSGGASKLLRLFRLMRLARLAKILKTVPEVMVLLKGMFVAVRGVSCTLVLLLVIMYVFAIAMTQLSRGTDVGDVYFGTTLDSLYTLFINGCVPDLVDTFDAIKEVDDILLSLSLFFLFLIFVLLSTFTVLNMLVGILCEVVSCISAVETEELKVQQVVEKISFVITEENIDGGPDQMLDRDEFETILTHPMAVRAIADIGVDVESLIDMTDFIYADHDHISQSEAMEHILNLRGTNGSTVKDLVDLRRFLTQELMDLEVEVLQGVEQKFDETFRRCMKTELLPVIQNAMTEFADKQPASFLGPFPLGAIKDGMGFDGRGRQGKVERFRSPSPGRGGLNRTMPF
jgi:voltage-gated sodium channel